MPVPQRESEAALGEAQLSLGGGRAGGMVPPPALTLAVPMASRGPAVMLHHAVPQPQPPQGMAQEPAAERPDGSGSSCASGTGQPWEKECLG